MLLRYLTHLTAGRLILWCYFIWYLVVLVRYFDPSLRLWLTSLGLSGIIGFALHVSTVAAGANRVKLVTRGADVSVGHRVRRSRQDSLRARSVAASGPVTSR